MYKEPDAKKTGHSDFAENPKSRHMATPLPSKLSHIEKLALYPSDSFWKTGSHITFLQNDKSMHADIHSSQSCRKT